jgi:hypothetical protein
MAEYYQTPEGLHQDRGNINVVVILVENHLVEAVNARLKSWFAERDEVSIVDFGDVESEPDLGYLILEWDEWEIDPLFLTILEQDDPIVNDTYFTYLRRKY